MSGMLGLGRAYDLGIAVVPVDLSGGAVTGKRIHLSRASGVSVVLFKGAASSGTDPALTFNAYAAASGGSASASYTGPTLMYKKSAATYTGAQTWSKVSVTPSSNVVTIASENGNQGLYLFDIYGTQLPDGFPFLEVDTADAGSVAQLGGILYILHDLTVQRTPANLAAQTA